MGLMDTLRSAFGLQQPLVPADPETPLALTPAAVARLAALPADHGIHVSTSPVADGHVVQVTEGPSQGPPPPPLDGHAVTASDTDLQRLRGLLLDHREGRWAVSADLEVRARETPNPDSRLYLTNRVLAQGAPAYFAAQGDHPPLARLLLEIPGVRSALIREATVAIERERDTPWDAVDRGVDGAIRQYLLLCGQPLQRDAASSDDPLEAEILQVLEERVLPGIHRDGGDLELVAVQDGVVLVQMHGACRSCPASTATLRLGVERTLKQAFPGRVERVEQV